MNERDADRPPALSVPRGRTVFTWSRPVSVALVFPSLVLAFLFVHLSLRLMEGSVLRWDESEQTLFTQALALGYNDQPPVYTWLLWCVFRFTGDSLLGIYLFKAVVLAALYLGLFALCRVLMPDRLAAPATASLLLAPYFAWTVLLDGAHTPFVAAFVPPTFLVVLRLLDRPTAIGFALLGLVLGLGFLAKYSFLLLAVALPVAMVTIPAYRARLKDPRLLLTLLLGALVVFPHARWVVEHWELIRERPMYRGGLLNPTGAGRVWLGLASLADSLGKTAGPILVALVLFFPRACWRALTQPATSDRARLLGRWLAVMAGMFLVLIVAGVSQFKQHWLIPILIVLPAYVFARVAEEPPSPARLRPFLIVLAAVAVGAAAVRVGLTVKDSQPGGKYWGRAVMHDGLAARVSELGAERGTFVGDYPLACGNLRLRHPEARVVCLYYPATVPPASDFTGPLYLVWEIADGLPLLPARDDWLVRLGLAERVDWERAEYFEVAAAERKYALRKVALVPVRAAGGR